MYSLGFLVLFLFGISFWFTRTPSIDNSRVEPADTAMPTEAKVTPQNLTLPEIPVHEEKNIEMKEKKSVQLQTTIRIRPLVVREKRDNLDSTK